MISEIHNRVCSMIILKYGPTTLVIQNYVAYRIYMYKYKMYCRLYSWDKTFYGIFHHVNFSIVFYAAIHKNIKSSINVTLFENFVHSTEY